MIAPREKDVGRRVVYPIGGGEVVEGTLDRVTEHYAFVTFDVWDRKAKTFNPGPESSPTAFAELNWKE